ncbi:hypothetical protein [Bradyrhizobium sp. AUGA SZCCT0182]|uniref:hypothetical protein n=1 Tax=Bradyrhizobium sp. AUGA SZCCT0182 TaxID=2807667 RepID=UPI001BAE0657|nr:hypothetical protein [Bradyrhizobium sp. AUGA SZCCT0182]MBR1237551.1 hypothetical protein [Bradyrhizobium sp. AUGA SZCCT0182]
MTDRKLSDKQAGNDQIGDIESAAVVGGRTEVTKAQYEKILHDRMNPPWWQRLFS